MRLRELLRGVGEGLASVVTMRRRGLFLLFTLLVWGCYLVQMRLSFFALQATSSLTWIDGVFLLVMCSLAVIVPVQGGIGAYHWVITQSLLLYGISNEDGFVFATVSHSAASLLIIGLGFVALLCVALIRNRVTDTGQHA